MSFADFENSIAREMRPAAHLGACLQALWFAQKGDWAQAHTLAQEVDGKQGAWVHAFLHRQEGDLSNAAYWYRRAGQPVPGIALPEEWAQIARSLLAAGS